MIEISPLIILTDIDEAAVILQALGSTSFWLLCLLLRSDLGGLTAYLTGTSEGAVDLACNQMIKRLKISATRE